MDHNVYVGFFGNFRSKGVVQYALTQKAATNEPSIDTVKVVFTNE